MARIKYYYDTETCKYERVRTKKSDVILNALGILSLTVIMAVGLLFLYSSYFESPKELILKNEVKDDRPMRQNNPTIPELRIKETNGDIESEKTKWLSLVNEYGRYSLPDNSFVHPFFGRMTREQIGYHAYKHTDHHLRQFSC